MKPEGSAYRCPGRSVGNANITSRRSAPHWSSVQQYSIGCIVAAVTAELSALHLVGRALSDPTRCRILVCLLDGPHYPTDLARHLQLTKANVSNHLAHLRTSGLVNATAEGRRVRYTLSDPRLAHALSDVAELATDIEASADLPTARAAS